MMLRCELISSVTVARLTILMRVSRQSPLSLHLPNQVKVDRYLLTLLHWIRSRIKANRWFIREAQEGCTEKTREKSQRHLVLSTIHSHLALILKKKKKKIKKANDQRPNHFLSVMLWWRNNTWHRPLLYDQLLYLLYQWQFCILHGEWYLHQLCWSY